MIEQKTILSLHSESTVQNVAVALSKTDGLDIFGTPETFRRPFPEELKEKLWSITPDQIVDEDVIQDLDVEVTEFFISVIQEMLDLHPEVKVDYLSISGHFVRLSSHDKYAQELGNLHEIARHFNIPTIGHYVQSDLNAGGTGSPLLSVFWQSMTKKIQKPLGIIGLGGVLKLTYIGPDGELGACDLGVGFALLEKWMNKHSTQSQDEIGSLAAKGKVDARVVKALMAHPYLSLKAPKAVHRNDFDPLLEQVEGLSLEDGCATLTEFIAEQIINSSTLFSEQITNWLFIGTGRKNTTLMLRLKQQLENVFLADDILPFSNHLNAVGYCFLGARCVTGLPISLPSTTGTDQEMTAGTIVYPKK